MTESGGQFFQGGKKKMLRWWWGVVVCCVRTSLAIKTGRIMREAPREPDATTDTHSRKNVALYPSFWFLVDIERLLLYIVALKGHFFLFFC